MTEGNKKSDASGATPEPPQAKNEVAEATMAADLAIPATANTGAHVETVQADITGKVRGVEQNPYAEIPDFNVKKLFTALVSYLHQLKAAIPTERKSSMDDLGKYLKQATVEITLEAADLKKMKPPENPEQRKLWAAVRQKLPADFLEHVEKYWTLDLELLTVLLNRLHDEGPNGIATVNENGFHMNATFLRELQTLLQEMRNGYRFNEDWQAILNKETEELQRLRKLSASHSSKKSPVESINYQDIAGAQIDDILYEDLVRAAANSPSPTELADKYAFAVVENYVHLAIGLAAQRKITTDIHFMDIDTLQEDDPRYYDERNPEYLFRSEADAFAYHLTTINRCLKAIKASQKLANLLR